MEPLKKLFPLSFGLTELPKFVLAVIAYAAIGVVAGGFTAFFACFYPFGIPFATIGSLAGLYAGAGIVVAALHYFKIF